MKLTNLIPHRIFEEIKDVELENPEGVAVPYLREFQAKYGYQLPFKFIGSKGEEHIFLTELPDLGQMSLVLSQATLMAKVKDKQAVFGIIYTDKGLQEWDIPICLMKYKKDLLETIPYDKKDKTNFSAKNIKFKDILK